MHKILAQVQSFLLAVSSGEARASPALVQEFKDLCGTLFEKHFVNQEPRQFSLRLSSLGRPSCQQEAEQLGMAAEPHDYSFPMRMLLGDMTEAAAVCIMKAAGVNVEATQKAVMLKDPEVPGTYDIKVDGKIYDIKSASPYSFTHKFSSGYNAVIADGDPFGYLGQGVGYAEAEGVPFGGWIAVNKATGEWVVTEIPDNEYVRVRDQGMSTLRANYRKLRQPHNGLPRKHTRCFEPVAETFRGKPTGNTLLGTTCGFCVFKWSCWPGLDARPSIPSQAKNPKLEYYVTIDPKSLVKNENVVSEG